MSQETIVVDVNGKSKAIVQLSQDPITNRLQLEPAPLDLDTNIKVFNSEGDLIPAIHGKVFLHVPKGVAVNAAAYSLAQISTFETGIRQSVKEPKHVFSRIALVSTWEDRCGIATYSMFLKEALESLSQIVTVKRYISKVTEPSLIHVQHEYGLFPESRFLLEKPSACGELPRIVTWHTVFRNPSYARIGSELISDYVKKIDEVFDAHIVHSAMAKKWLMPITKKPIYIVPHGSVTWPRIGRVNAREKLGLPLDDKIIFAFGFSATTKGYDELASIVKQLRPKYPLQLIISGAIHGSGSKENEEILERIIHSEGTQVLRCYLSEEEVNLCAEAADLLVFNYYNTREIASASGAIHRLLYSGSPIIVSDDFRSADLQDGVHCLKFPMGDMDSLKACIEILLTESDLATMLAENASQLAEATSWRRVAQRHLEIYSGFYKSGQILRDVYDANYYDEEYFIGKNGGKTFLNPNQTEVRKWSYYNAEGEWAGAGPIMEAIKILFEPSAVGTLKMLDVGCGRGTFTSYAKDVGIEARGIDFSKWAVCYDTQTEILTPEGWKKYSQINVGDTVLSFNPFTERLVEDTVHEKIVQRYIGKMLEIKSLRTDLLVTPNHNILYKNAEGYRGPFVFRVTKACDFPMNTAIKIPCAYPIEDKPDYPILDDLIKLAGWIISEGHFADDGRLDISQRKRVHPEKYEEIRRLVEALRLRYYKHPEKIRISVHDSRLLKIYLQEKRIPRLWLKKFSTRQLELLLETLMEGDGYQKAGTNRYYSADEVLIGQVQELVTKLGYKSSLLKNEEGVYNLGFVKKHDEWIQKKRRNTRWIPYDGEVWCVTTSNGFVIVRRNNKVSISGNSHPYPKAKGHIQVGDVRHMDFPDASFNLLFCSDIMEHLYSKDAPDLDQTISEIQRISQRWIFYNIGTTMSDDSEYFQLGKGEAVPLKWQGTTVAGHVTVMSPSWWRKKLTENPQWKLRDDLVEEFRSLVAQLAKRSSLLTDWNVLANWRTIIITEKVVK